MARIEVRRFKSKTQLLIIAETRREFFEIKQVLGLRPGMRSLQTEVLTDDQWEAYIRITKPKDL